MAMPSGDSPEKAQEFYQYLQAHHETDGRVVTWNVDWFSLAWLWGFMIVLTRRDHLVGLAVPDDAPAASIRSTASAGTRPSSQARRRASSSCFTVVLTGFAVAIIVGHLVWGQKF